MQDSHLYRDRRYYNLYTPDRWLNPRNFREEETSFPHQYQKKFLLFYH